jgi:hypothetical protein
VEEARQLARKFDPQAARKVEVGTFQQVAEACGSASPRPRPSEREGWL